MKKFLRNLRIGAISYILFGLWFYMLLMKEIPLAFLTLMMIPLWTVAEIMFYKE